MLLAFVKPPACHAIATWGRSESPHLRAGPSCIPVQTAITSSPTKILNMRIRASHDGDDFGIQRQHGSQIEKRFADPRAFALVSIEVDVGLDDAELQLAGLDGVYIVD